MVSEHLDRWPRARSLLTSDAVAGRRTLHLVGAHTYATSVTPRSATPTPPTIRNALERYSTFAIADDLDLATAISIVDHGDIDDADATGATELGALMAAHRSATWLLLGGDNALTWRALSALAGDDLANWGLITFDAHLDMRDGVSNGSPVRQLLEQGLRGEHVVQVGLNDFSNSAHYAAQARAAGSTLISRRAVAERGIATVVANALAVAGAGGRPVYVDIDVDVCDRAVVPGCPAAAPGGLSADELRQAARLVSLDPRVKALDLTEIDVSRDSADERTIRLAALLTLEIAAGVARRPL